MTEPIYSYRHGSLAAFEGCHMNDNYLIELMSFIHSRKKGRIIQYSKSRETNRGSILNKEFDVVGSISDLFIYEFNCLVRIRDTHKATGEEAYKDVTAQIHIFSRVTSLGSNAHLGRAQICDISTFRYCFAIF